MACVELFTPQPRKAGWTLPWLCIRLGMNSPFAIGGPGRLGALPPT